MSPCGGGERLTLDVWLVARLAVELNEALSGARIQGISADAAGLRLSCYRRGGPVVLRATSGTNGPLIAVADGSDAPNENVAGGWAGGVAPLLRGCTVESVQAVPGDRIILLDAVSRSAFGVPARHRIAFELEPNKSNTLVLRPTPGGRWQILAAAKEIEGREGARDVLIGEAYTPPPARAVRLDTHGFAAAVSGLNGVETRALARLLGEFDPFCSPPVAREVVERVMDEDGNAQALPARLLSTWASLRNELEAAASDARSPIYAWRQGETYGVCHLIRLTWPPGGAEVFPSLNEVCSAEQSVSERRRHAPAVAALRKRLTTMLDRCDAEIASLRAAQRRAEEAEAFRLAGETIYTYLAQIPERADSFTAPTGEQIALDAQLSAKENAAVYFRRFKRARSGLPRIAQRLTALQGNRTYWEELTWQLDKAQSGSSEDLAVVTEEIADAIGVRKTAQRKRSPKPLPGRTVGLGGGAIAHVGRSPKDNERVTFSVGAPNDLWFHARGVPGAHVILKMPNAGDVPPDAVIEEAAALAAGQSRAAASGKVEVDYTQRKHVRKQGGGKVGLVWYTEFKTVLVQPRRL